jgi:hypothetical protein
MTLQFLSLQGGNGRCGFLPCWHHNEAKPTGIARKLVFDNFG